MLTATDLVPLSSFKSQFSILETKSLVSFMYESAFLVRGFRKISTKHDIIFCGTAIGRHNGSTRGWSDIFVYLWKEVYVWCSDLPNSQDACDFGSHHPVGVWVGCS